ncbi:hypothetical protein KKC_06047 [Listeria fleischmannii subsp. coloradonensis]|nr:hypothetical protein KKC_06047 [Listeria fleischmannii subsp. coloradonensis]STY35966.1 Uncharacterised protein [Listeria fleischmannii subsp. coloradonensis]
MNIQKLGNYTLKNDFLRHTFGDMILEGIEKERDNVVRVLTLTFIISFLFIVATLILENKGKSSFSVWVQLKEAFLPAFLYSFFISLFYFSIMSFGIYYFRDQNIFEPMTIIPIILSLLLLILIYKYHTFFIKYW